jgi:hypothetical protein
MAAVSMILASIVIKTVFSSMWRGRSSNSAGVGPILKMVGWMSVFDVLYTGKFLLSFASTRVFIDTPGWCRLMAFVGQSCAAGTTTLNFCIALDVLLIQRSPFHHKSHMWVPRYIAITLSVALLTALAMLPMDAYGIAFDGTCWINVEHLQLIFWVPLLGYMTFCGAVLLLFWVNRRRENAAGGGRGGRGANSMAAAVDPRIVTRMAVFTLAFMLTWTPETILFILTRAGVPAPRALNVINALFMSALGSVNFFVWRKQLASLSAGGRGVGASRHGGHALLPKWVALPCWCVRGANTSAASDSDDSEMAHVHLRGDSNSAGGQNPGAPETAANVTVGGGSDGSGSGSEGGSVN